ncbi:MAG: gfo/Idh/MocA family oxidoreductase, partial [Isosphaeraceae bacterium]
FPGPKGEPHDRVIVTYSSINTNRFENYGETVYGNRGTMIVEEEKEILLFKEPNPNNPKGGGGRNTSITMETKGKQPVMETSPSAAGPSEASSLGGTATSTPISRGYREELEHFAYCIRHGGGGSEHKDYHGDTDNQPRCTGEVAMADAIVALTSNLAMSTNKRIEFQSSWFDYKTRDVPDGSAEEIASRA